MMADKFFASTGFDIENVAQGQINPNYTGGSGSPVPVAAGGGGGGGGVNHYNNQNNSKNTYNINVTSTQDGAEFASEFSDTLAKG
jgi:hypothetical protein